MDLESTLKLINAGYTKDEIAAMEAGTPKTEPPKQEQPKQEPPKQETEQPKQEPPKDPANVSGDVAATIKALTETVNGLNATVKAMQEANAKAANVQSNNTNDPIKAAMDSFLQSL